MKQNINIYLRDDQKNLGAFCKGDDCEKKDECLRYVATHKIFRLSSTNCKNLNFDLFLPKGKQDAKL